VPLSFSARPGDLEQARRLLEAAEQEEPGKCVTYDHIGWSHYFETRARWATDPGPSLDLAEGYASKAVEMDDPSGMGHMLLAAVLLSRGEHERALEAGWEAMDRRPGCPWAYAILGNVCNYVGRSHQALELVERAARLSPLVPSLFPAVAATGLYLLGRLDDAASAAHAALELDAESVDCLVVLAATLAASGRRAEASEVAERLRRALPQFSLAAFAARQPYSDPVVLEGLITDLHAAGL
jgi:tetratricopeptide (TPR) repeat protein